MTPLSGSRGRWLGHEATVKNGGKAGGALRVLVRFRLYVEVHVTSLHDGLMN